jgi:hypothetical protein
MEIDKNSLLRQNVNEVDVQHLYPCLIIKIKVISIPNKEEEATISLAVHTDCPF